MTNETEAPEHGYLICKNGIFYRPDSSGYTSAKAEAGRYSLKDAIYITHPNGPDGPRDGMTYIHESDVPDPRADPFDAQAARIAELEAERDRLHERAHQLRHERDCIASGEVAQKARAEAAEAKLARATELAATTGYWVCAETRHATLGLRVEKEIRTALAELKGGQ